MANPAIALQVRPPDIMNPGQLLTLQNVAQQSQLGKMQLEDMYQARNEQDQLKGLFNTPGAIDQKTGTVSLEGIHKAYGISPKAAQGMAQQRQVSLKNMADLDKVTTDTIAAKAKFLRDGLASVTDQASYDAWRAQGIELGAQSAAKAPPVFDPKWQMKNVMDADKFIAQNTPKIEPTDIGGEIRMIDRNPVTNPAIKGTVLAKTTTPAEKLADARAKDAKLAADGKATNEQENKMRDDYTKATGKFVEVRDAYQRVLESAANPSAAGDMALIFSFMRALDPASTVREGEFATAQNAGGIPDRIRGQYNKVLSGERLADNIRADFVDRSKRLYEGALVNQEEVERDYEEKAKRAGARPEQVVTRHRVKDRGGNNNTQEIEEKVKAAGWKYEPAKYEYRTGPGGELQRRLKNG